MSEHDVREAFDAYRTDPGGEVRIDTSAITSAGRKRVRRNQVLIGAAGFAVVATLVGVAVAVPKLADNERGLTVAEAPKLPPTSGRDLNVLFEGARGWTPEVKTQAGGDANETAAKFLGKLGTNPATVDTGWQAGPEGSKKPSVLGAVYTWVDGEKAAEGVLTVVNNPVHTMIFPAPYTVCSEKERTGGTCSVREVKGKGWLKEVTTATGALRVSLQVNNGPAVDFLVTDGAATRAGLADGRQALGKLPVEQKAVSDAVVGLA
jgi:hypothetical protein